MVELKKRNAPDADYAPVRVRQQAAGKRLDFTQNYIVREDTSEPAVADYHKVISETPLPGGIKSFWVHKSILNGGDSFTGSKLLLGYYIFRGGDGLFVNNQVPILDLGDVVDALYEGKLSAKAAKNCVFTPSAQQADFKKRTGDYSLYAVRTASWSPERYFAMPRHGKQLGQVSVRYSGSEEFTGGDGAVFSIPVFVPEPAVKE